MRDVFCTVQYYNYPTQGYKEGINLGDVLSDEYPFTHAFLDNGLSEGPYTYRDVWDATEVLLNDYVYDTVLDLVRQ